VRAITVGNATGVNFHTKVTAKVSEAREARPINANCSRLYRGNFTYEGGY